MWLQWCQHFHLQKGVQVRRLRVSLRDSRPDIMYVIGIDVRPGRGRYRNTNIVTLSPRFQLHNKSTYQLQFAQLCFATTLVSAFTIFFLRGTVTSWDWTHERMSAEELMYYRDQFVTQYITYLNILGALSRTDWCWFGILVGADLLPSTGFKMNFLVK